MSKEQTVHEGLRLEVVTRQGLALRTQAEEVEARSVFGDFGVLPGHLPMLVALHPGVLFYKSKGLPHKAVIGQGFAEVQPDSVLVLSEHFVNEDDISPSQTKEMLERDRKHLDELRKKGVLQGAQVSELKARIGWCEAELALVETWPPGKRGGTGEDPEH